MNDRSSFVADQMLMLGMGFLLPGLVPLFALATVSPTVQSWFGYASAAPTLAGFFFGVLGALALGFVLTAVRFTLYEREVFGRPCLVPKPTPFDEAKRKDYADEYRDLRQAFYYHYLASANLSVAIPLGLVIWMGGTVAQGTFAWLAAVIAAGIAALATWALRVGACEAIRRYDEKRGKLLPMPKQPEQPAA